MAQPVFEFQTKLSLTKRWSEAGYLSQIVLAHALRQVSVSLILDVRQKIMKFIFQKLIRKPELASIEDIKAAGCASIWVGNFTDEDKLMDYISPSGAFEEHFGFRMGENDSPEITTEPQLTPIRELLTGFSWSKDFIEEACSQADAQGITHANCAVVWHYINYSALKRTPKPEAMLHFLGVASFS